VFDEAHACAGLTTVACKEPFRVRYDENCDGPNPPDFCLGRLIPGATYFIPVFIQGVLGNNATNSGGILIPMSVSMIGMSILTGLLISRTGRYKLPVLAGLVVMAFGFYLLTLMDRETTNATVIRNMVIIGFGLGTSMQTFTLIVQNAADAADLGVATATTQLSRSVGSALGVAILGTVLTSRLAVEIPRHVPAGAAAGAGSMSAGSVLNPAAMAGLPPQVLEGIREALSASLHTAFIAALPFTVIALVATLFIREVPLRTSLHPQTGAPTVSDAEPEPAALSASSSSRGIG